MIQSADSSCVPLASPTEIVAQVVEVVQNLFSDAKVKDASGKDHHGFLHFAMFDDIESMLSFDMFRSILLPSKSLKYLRKVPTVPPVQPSECGTQTLRQCIRSYQLMSPIPKSYTGVSV